MAGKLEYILGNPSEGINIWLRDTHLGYSSGLWEVMEKQQAEDAVMDICVLFTRSIRKNDRDYTTPILATNVIGGYKTTSLGQEVAQIIVNATMKNCGIVQYSINANQVGNEKANNRLSMVVYAHFDEPHSKQEAILLAGNEIEKQVMKPIDGLLAGYNVFLGMSNYDNRAILWNRNDLEELLIAGSKGCRFVKGHFYE